MNQKLHNNLKIQSIATAKAHLTINSENENSVHAWQHPTINHMLEFQQLVHSVIYHKNNYENLAGLTYVYLI